MMIKSVAIKHHLPALQQEWFLQGFRLLYSRYLTENQKHDFIQELNECATSDNITMKLYYLIFHFDTKANPAFNLFKHPPNDITIQHICSIFQHIQENNIEKFPQLNNDHPPMTATAIQQRFFNQLVYGSFGLQSKPYNPTRTKSILNTLITCCNTSITTMATKALHKHQHYLNKESKRYEEQSDIDALMIIDTDKTTLTQHLQ